LVQSQATVPGGRISNSTTSPSATVVGNTLSNYQTKTITIMLKHNTPKWKAKLANPFIRPKLYFLFVITFCFNQSCKKFDSLKEENQTNQISYTEKFFNNNRTKDKREIAIVDYLKRVNEKENFINKTVTQIGFPRWDKTIYTKKNNANSILTTNDSLGTYYIPFVRDSQNYVNAAIIIEVNPSDTSFQFKCDWQYTQMQNSPNSVQDSAENLAVFFMKLDYSVFRNKKFSITDHNLFKKNNKNALFVELDTTTQNSGNNLFDVEGCSLVTISWNDCPYPTDHCSGSNGSCDGCWRCTSSISYTYCTGGGGGGTSGGGPPGNGGPTGPPSGGPNGSGGNGGGWTPAPPYVFIDNPCAYILHLQNDANFRNKVLALKNNSAYNAGFEKGYTVNNVEANDYAYVQGAAGDNTINWSLPYGAKVDGFMHCHYGGLLNNVFSPQDVIYMARAFLQGYARDTANMFFIVTNQSDNPYLIKINNIAKFRTFAKNIAGEDGNDEKKMKKFRDKYDPQFISADRDKNTVAFLNMLQKEVGKGLAMFRANDDVTQWSKLRLTTNDTDFSGDYCPEP
jgi:hypothetical protein